MTNLPDNTVMPFEIKPLGVRGRIVRLGNVVDDILHKHDYPAPVSALLAEAVALTAMLGASLKFDGKFILQTNSDGPVDLLVADFSAPGGIRGYARFDADMVAKLKSPTPQALLGKGHLAMTIDQGVGMERYQGIVSLGGVSLTEAALGYFQQSEQIPTRLRLAAGVLAQRGARPEAWRAGAIMVQHLPRHGGISPMPLHSGDVPEGKEETVVEDDHWVKARLLLDTVEDHELLDPLVTPEELLYRLYHEDGVTVYPAVTLERHCTCSRDKVGDLLKSFSDDDRAAMKTNGIIDVTCEFCSTHYQFAPEEVEPETQPQ
ncbi:Hsp33 family molecular chaperone [Nordella sp. HKS 07]|uniref:Hsp33 family molecular chaperone n=1 Tax=Nordella sp. HKS 07 TaxID=2712222 RepID=UPI0013E182C8|nr:Hsp33 family molecular chaperone [Nordella sp. HKS 07]QIG48938.1 Hsp33 family molecular chaperone [Nordella sp. HKS 07]